MDKKIVGLLGAAATLTAVSGAQAMTPQGTELAPATSYADLLQPVPNAASQLMADDARLAEQRTAQLTVHVGPHHHHHHFRHHHHHHHRYFRHHHHHHHHHHGVYIR